MFWTSGVVYPEFQRISSPLCNGFLRFTYGATPTDLLVASMAAEPFLSMYLYTCIQALVGLEPGIECVAQCMRLPNEPC